MVEDIASDIPFDDLLAESFCSRRFRRFLHRAQFYVSAIQNELASVRRLDIQLYSHYVCMEFLQPRTASGAGHWPDV